MPLTVLSPVAGTVVDVADVPDPVFAEQMVGPGVAVEPADGVAVAPVDGRVVSLHPHAFVVQGDGGAVLVHLGIDTVQLRGDGFDVRTAQDDHVTAGQVLVTWDPGAVRAGGRATVCPVVVLEVDAGAMTPLAAPGSVVAAGDPLLRVG
ncbi:PTS system N-acetylglucosamine-specific IIA component [Isoptericola jiangsuensis]|uniref:PTS system N-acetylglucosamine-specific IIA component n=1 Tax=Isoptericola jiangsuensis TaxID=548579 RepID=A0A2A9ES64_9MICO|nr:PTS glucose transporter subunit IIA [Isoptericola jiangsuensis]PFG41718.1 PTS system N-acetylglucosamine-specific IIA component [Isoptericola jiangsuensis]